MTDKNFFLRIQALPSKSGVWPRTPAGPRKSIVIEEKPVIKIEKPPVTDKVYGSVRDVLASQLAITLPPDPSEPLDFSDFRERRFGPAPLANYRYNSKIEVSGVINGQGLDPVKRMKYGMTYAEKTGCGLIAIYNALILLDNPQNLADIILWGDHYAAILCGCLGSNPWAAGGLFRQMGYTVKSVSDQSQYDVEAKKADVCLFTYWNNIPKLMRGMHSVCARYERNAVKVYNPSSYRDDPIEKDSFAKWIAEDNIGPVAFLTVSK